MGKFATERKQQNPVEIPANPSCDNCIDWSEDGLAVATGENAYILTLKHRNREEDSIEDRLWVSESVRINLFDEKEWPVQDLATIEHLSLGEELSESIAVALAWSAPGLGIHRRCVLAVLTSNLLLSLWETDESSGRWRRTCVVNQAHRSDVGTPEDIGSHEHGAKVRKTRVRAFKWLRPIQTLNNDKWGDHYLAIANDLQEIFILRVSKSLSNDFGGWRLEPVWHDALPNPTQRDSSREYTSPLQSTLQRETPITSLEVDEWQIEKIDDEGRYLARSKLQVNRNCPVPQTTSVPVEILGPPAKLFVGAWPIARENLQMRQLGAKTRNIWEQNAPGNKIPSTYTNFPGSPWWKECPGWSTALQKLCSNFDQKYGLGGYFRVRFWGSTISPIESMLAGVVTLHPLDMYVYQTHASEQCFVVFRNINAELGPSQVAQLVKTTDTVIEEIATVISNLANSMNAATGLDIRIIRACIALARLKTLSPTVIISLENALVTKPESEPIAMERAHSSLQPDIPETRETCEVCHMPFELGVRSESFTARCPNRHEFPRCNLSFIALQRPNISKSCSKCSKVYLDLAKLKVTDDCRISQALFSEFDVCPYCHGKFRG